MTQQKDEVSGRELLMSVQRSAYLQAVATRREGTWTLKGDV
jgi:hypothetical protein